jgi:hypothetical protein
MPRPRKKSKDPRQEALRSLKDQWNASVSSFISDVISLKRGVNGRGDANKGIAPSKIQDPLPGEISSLLSALTSDFQALTSGVGAIEAAQANYSQTRRKSQPKGPKQPRNAPSTAPTSPQEASPPNDQVVQQLSTLGTSKAHLIEKYGSSRSSRFWEYTKSLVSRKPLNRERIGLLRSASDVWFSVLDLENDILSLSLDTIPSSIFKLQMIKYNLEALRDAVSQLPEPPAEPKPRLSPTPPPKPADYPEPSTTQTNQEAETETEEDEAGGRNPQLDADVGTIKLRLNTILQEGIGYQNEIQKLNTHIDRFFGMSDRNFQELISRIILDEYKKLLKNIRGEKPEEFKPLWKKINAIKIQATYSHQEIVKEAHNMASRFLKRQLVKAIPFNKTAVPRLQIVQQIDAIKKELQKMMNSLEKEVNKKLLNDGLTTIESKIEVLHKPLSVLKVLNKENFYTRERKKLQKKRPRGEQDDLFMDRVLRRRLWKDLGTEL